jgi:hypothetical protein
MRKFNKYKNFFKIGFILKNFPLRLLNFKKSKWLIIKKKLNLRLKRNSIFSPIIKKNTFKNWFKLKTFYKKNLENNLLLTTFYDKSINFKKIKKEKTKKKLKNDIISITFLKLEFQINVLLYHLNFFDSVYKVNQELNNGNILLNNSICYFNTLLKCGDVINFNDACHIDIKSVKNKISLNERILTFVEVDYYTRTIIVIKNMEELSSEDLFLLLSDF